VKPYQKLQRFWAEAETGVVPAQRGETDISVLENTYGVRLPEDFREYLLCCCPAESCGMDSSATEWWGFSALRSVMEANGQSVLNRSVAASADKYLFFADFLIGAPTWAIACGEDENRGRIVAIHNSESHFVAGSFAEFVERFVVEPVGLAWLPSPS
jgi:hypothetical protein